MTDHSMEIAEQAINNLRSSMKCYDIGNPGEINKSGVMELSVVRGMAIATGIHKTKDIGIVELHASDGTTFAPHIHKGKREVIQVISGEIEVWINVVGEDIPKRDPDRRIGRYEAIILEPNVPHAVRVIGNLKCIVSTMPAEENFPNARQH